MDDITIERSGSITRKLLMIFIPILVIVGFFAVTQIIIALNKKPEEKRRPFNPLAVLALNSLCQETGAYIVISSTHRHGYAKERISTFEQKFENTLNMLKTGMPELQNHIRLFLAPNDPHLQSWCTPYIKNYSRGEHIEHWLKIYKQYVKNFVIIDDENDMTESLMPHFVKINADIHGLAYFQLENYHQALDDGLISSILT